MLSFGITSESGTLKRVLVHHPGKELELANTFPIEHHFDQSVDIGRFRKDHKMMMHALSDAGVEVLDIGTLLNDNPTLSRDIEMCPNLVFTRDSSFVTDSGVALMRMGLPTRRRETPIIKATHEALGNPISFELKAPDTFEGGGFALLEGRTAVSGLCSRTTQGALDNLKNFLFEEKLVDTFIILNVPPNDIHIDGDFTELPNKIALVHTDSVDYSSAVFHMRSEIWEGSFVEWLKNEGWDILKITSEERDNMAANFLTIDNNLAIHYMGNKRVIEEVRKRGIDVIQIPGEEMRKGNGGIHCMTCPILRV